MPNIHNSSVILSHPIVAPETLRNRVFFSKHLTAYQCWKELETALKRQGVKYELLPHTTDIWARDYMPVQCMSNRYVTYEYNPDYLQRQPQYITNWQTVIQRHRLPIHDSQLLQKLQPHFDVIELHYDVSKPHKWNWAYINYLLVDGKLFMPRLNAEEDEQAYTQLSVALNIPTKHIELIDIHTILKAGGGLNCISWTIFANRSPLLHDELTSAMHKEFSIDEETEI